MNFRHIEIFFAVMTCGTVTEAARQLGVSQPSVTTTIQQAERKLGIQLFRRESGRLLPTQEAMTLFEEAERAHEVAVRLGLGRHHLLGHSMGGMIPLFYAGSYRAIQRLLGTAGLPDPDLLIRTGGDQRVSNFLLWQLAYAELYFTPRLWPDFGRDDLARALADFHHRKPGRTDNRTDRIEHTYL